MRSAHRHSTMAWHPMMPRVSTITSSILACIADHWEVPERALVQPRLIPLSHKEEYLIEITWFFKNESFFEKPNNFNNLIELLRQ
jgi:hypothetical protein